MQTEDILTLIEELAEIERLKWADGLDALRRSGVPLMADDGDTGGEGDSGDGDGNDDDADNGDDGHDDGDDAELAKARKVIAKLNADLKRARDERNQEDVQAKKDAGKYKDLYDEAKAELDKVRSEIQQGAKQRLAESALGKLKAINPSRAVKMLDLEDIEDEADAERAAKRLLKSDAYLFDKTPSRQKRAAGDNGDEDDADTDKPKRQMSRIQKGLAATAPK